MVAGILTADNKLLFYHCLMLVRKVGGSEGADLQKHTLRQYCESPVVSKTACNLDSLLSTRC